MLSQTYLLRIGNPGYASQRVRLSKDDQGKSPRHYRTAMWTEHALPGDAASPASVGPSPLGPLLLRAWASAHHPGTPQSPALTPAPLSAATPALPQALAPAVRRARTAPCVNLALKERPTAPYSRRRPKAAERASARIAVIGTGNLDPGA